MAKVTKEKQNNKKVLIGLLIIIAVLLGWICYSFNPISPANFRPLTTTYSGKLPCADCSGLLTTLTLIKQKNIGESGYYVMHELYEGKTTTPYITEGTWLITKGTPDNPEASVLQLTQSNAPGVTYYRIDGETLTMLNQQKEKIDSPFNETLTATKKTTQQLANPASENCAKVGGTLIIKTRGDGGQYGLCQFEDNQACEEWALYRGECPIGGVKTTGFDTVEQQYCAWVGGKTLAVPNASCTLPSGKVCADKALYNGTCQ